MGHEEPPKEGAGEAASEDEKETASLGGDELDQLIKESGSKELGDLDTNTMGGNEMELLLAEVRRHQKSDRPGEARASKSAPPPPDDEASSPFARAPSAPPETTKQTVPAPPPDSVKATRQVARIEIPKEARRSDAPPPPDAAAVYEEILRPIAKEPLPKMGLQLDAHAEPARPVAPSMAPETEAEVREAEASMREGSARRKKIGAVIAGVIAIAGLVFVVRLMAYDPRVDDDTASASTATSVAPPPVATGAATVTAEVTMSPIAVKARADARATLERFQEGLRDCVKKAIGVLPGSSPAVPSSPAALKGAGYSPALNDLHTPVWTCAKLRVDPPMRFAIQWQSIKPGTEGQAVAWIDDDGDGTIDTALAFHATLKSHGVVETTAVAPIDKATPVIAVRERAASPSADSVY